MKGLVGAATEVSLCSRIVLVLGLSQGKQVNLFYCRMISNPDVVNLIIERATRSIEVPQVSRCESYWVPVPIDARDKVVIVLLSDWTIAREDKNA